MSAQPLLTELETQLRANWDAGELWAVYADALLAHGDPRGELISLELRATQQGPDASLRAEIDALQATHEAAWCPSASESIADYSWHRGFIVGLRTRRLEHEDELERLASALADAQLRMLGQLDLRVGAQLEPAFSAALGALTLGPLRRLRLVYTPMGKACVMALRRLPPTLEQLDLRYAGLDDEALARVLSHLQARPSGASGLRRLWLQHNHITAAGASQLARSEALAQLELLDLRANPLTTAGVRSLAHTGTLRELKTLVLELEGVELAGAELLANSATLHPDITRFWAARRQRERAQRGET